MRLVLMVLPLLLVTLAGCAGGDETTPTQAVDVDDATGILRGVVVDASISPLADVTIALTNGQETLTDADGLFEFAGLEPDTYFIEASRIGYEPIQTSTIVEAGVPEPALVNIQLMAVAGFDPFLENLKFDGLYECAYAFVFQTDSCDWVIRTIHDAGVTVVPRGIQNNVNTEFYTMAQSGETLIQEGWFDTKDVQNFWFSVAKAPIDNACDCSDSYLDIITDTGYGIGRLDKGVTAFPDPGAEQGLEYAVRGFVPFQQGTDVAIGFNIDFTIITSVFHGYNAPEGWNYENAGDFPQP